MANKSHQVVHRVYKYERKADRQQVLALIAHIGTAWEPVLHTFPNKGQLDEVQINCIRRYVISFYRTFPDHPYHPERRKFRAGDGYPFLPPAGVIDAWLAANAKEPGLSSVEQFREWWIGKYLREEAEG